MARRIVSVTTQTPTATADTVALVDATYPFLLRGGSATQEIRIWEISVSGQAPSTSSPTIMLLSQDSTVGTGANTNGADRKSTRLNSSHQIISYAVFCLKKKKEYRADLISVVFQY